MRIISNIRAGLNVEKKFKKAAEKGLWKGMEGVVLTEANRIIPHDEGTLERSGFIDADGLVAAISYDTPYAIKLHEHPEYNFRGNGEGKWVEKTIKRKDVQEKVLEAIAQEIRKEL